MWIRKTPKKKGTEKQEGAFVNTQTKLYAVLMVFFMVLSSYKGTGTHELWETDWVLTYSNNWEILASGHELRRQ